MRKKRRPIARVRVLRRVVFAEILIAIGLCAALGIACSRRADEPPLQIREERLMTPGATVHIITMPPEPTPRAWARYPVALSDELQRYTAGVCAEHGVDPALVMAIIERESRCDAACIGDGGESFGLMQIYESFHRERMARLGVEDLLEPEGNILVGVDLLAELYTYSDSTAWVLMAYNGGAAYADRMTAQGLVSDYAAGIMERAEALDEGAQLAAG